MAQSSEAFVQYSDTQSLLAKQLNVNSNSIINGTGTDPVNIAGSGGISVAVTLADPLTVIGLTCNGPCDITPALSVASGGTGTNMLTGVVSAHGTNSMTADPVSQFGVLVGTANGVTSVSQLQDGELLIGSTAGNPIPASLGVGAHLTATVGSGTLSIQTDATPVSLVSTIVARDGSGNAAFNTLTTQVNYTPANDADWVTVPTLVAPALDQLAERVTAGGGGGIVVTNQAFVSGGPANTLVSTSPATNGQILVGSSGSAPVATTLSSNNHVAITNGPGSITVTSDATNLNLPQTMVARDAGGSFAAGTITATFAYMPADPTKWTTIPNNVSSALDELAEESGSGIIVTQNAFVAGGAGNTLISTSPATNGQLLVGSTGGQPVAATLTAGTYQTVTNGPGSITIGSNATASNTPSTVVARDASGNFSAATVNATVAYTPADSSNWPSVPTAVQPALDELAATVTAAALDVTNQGFIYGAASNTLGSTAAATNGQLLIGSTGVPPVAATLTGASHVTVVGGAGSITLSTDAQSTNTASTIVARDASGNFAANVATLAGATNGASLLEFTGAGITVAGNTGLGTNSPQYVLDVVSTTAPVQGYGTIGVNITHDVQNYSSEVITTYCGTQDDGSNIIFQQARGTKASPSATQNGDTIGSVCGIGYGATAFQSFDSTPAMNLVATENFTDTAAGSGIRFYTTPNGTAEAQIAMFLDNDGTVVLEKALTVANGGTGLTAVPAGVLFGDSNTMQSYVGLQNGIFIANGNGLSSVALTSGQVLIGTIDGHHNPAVPVAATLNCTNNITGTPASGSFTISDNGTATATASTLVARDASGNFAANVITAGVAYTPAVPANWTAPPSAVAPALDELAAAVTAAELDVTNQGFIYGAPSNTLGSTAAATNGQLLIGSTGLPPVAATLTPSSHVTVVNAAGAVTIGTDAQSANTVSTLVARDASGNFAANVITAGVAYTPAVPANWSVPPTAVAPALDELAAAVAGGSGIVVTNHAFVSGGPSNTLVSSAAATNGQILIGSTGANPVAANLVAGAHQIISNGAGSITIGSDATSLPTGSTIVARQSDGSIQIVGMDCNGGTIQNPGNINIGVSPLVISSGDVSVTGGGLITSSISTMTGIQGPSNGALSFPGVGGISVDGPIAFTSLSGILTTHGSGDPMSASQVNPYGVVTGIGANGVTSTAAMTNGQIPIGSTGANPVAATLTCSNNLTGTPAPGAFTIADNGTSTATASTLVARDASGNFAANVITAGVAYTPAVPANWSVPPTAVAPALDELAAAVAEGSGIVVTNRAFVSGGPSNTLVSSTAATNGQLLIGSTGANPVAANITAGTHVTVTNGAGSITLATDASSANVPSTIVARDASGIASFSQVITDAVTTTGVQAQNIVVTGDIEMGASSNIDGCNQIGVNGSMSIYGPINGYYDAGLPAASVNLAAIGGATFTSGNSGAWPYIFSSPGGIEVSGPISGSVNYTPAVPANWQVVPSAVSPALDELAAAVAAGSGIVVTNHGFISGGPSNTLVSSTAATNGQLLIGSTGASPVAATITAGSHQVVTNGAGSITIASDATSANTVSTVVARDASGNFSAGTITANVAYTPAVPGDWTVAPTTVAQGLDMIVANPIMTQFDSITYYVDTNFTGNPIGTSLCPFQTFAQVHAAIGNNLTRTDPWKLYNVIVKGGVYNESPRTPYNQCVTYIAEGFVYIGAPNYGSHFVPGTQQNWYIGTSFTGSSPTVDLTVAVSFQGSPASQGCIDRETYNTSCWKISGNMLLDCQASSPSSMQIALQNVCVYGSAPGIGVNTAVTLYPLVTTYMYIQNCQINNGINLPYTNPGDGKSYGTVNIEYADGLTWYGVLSVNQLGSLYRCQCYLDATSTIVSNTMFSNRFPRQGWTSTSAKPTWTNCSLSLASVTCGTASQSVFVDAATRAMSSTFGTLTNVSLISSLPALTSSTGTALSGVVTANGTSPATVSTVTANGVVIGGASNSVTTITALTNGQVVIGSTGAAPVAGSITYGTHLSATAGAGTLQINTDATNANTASTIVARDASGNIAINTLTAAAPIVVSSGGTGAATLTGVLTGNGTSAMTASTVTANGVILGGASNAVSSTSALTNGQIVIGSTGANPVAGSITYDTHLSGVTGAGTLQIVTDATSTNTASTIVARDASGNFSAGSITVASEVVTTNLSAAGVYTDNIVNYSGTQSVTFGIGATSTTMYKPLITNYNISGTGNLSLGNVSGAGYLYQSGVAATGTSSVPATQGTFIGWSRNGDGVTSISNERGLGTGGFEFLQYDSTGALIAQDLTISNASSVTTIAPGTSQALQISSLSTINNGALALTVSGTGGIIAPAITAASSAPIVFPNGADLNLSTLKNCATITNGSGTVNFTGSGGITVAGQSTFSAAEIVDGTFTVGTMQGPSSGATAIACTGTGGVTIAGPLTVNGFATFNGGSSGGGGYPGYNTPYFSSLLTGTDTLTWTSQTDRYYNASNSGSGTITVQLPTSSPYPTYNGIVFSIYNSGAGSVIVKIGTETLQTLGPRVNTTWQSAVFRLINNGGGDVWMYSDLNATATYHQN